MVSLNDEQKTAAQYDGDRLLVLAGPGTGKTTALIGRYIHLLNKGVDPKKILCCAFSRKAATEINNRIKKEIDIDIDKGNLTTFHALGNKIVREYGHLIDISPPKTILSDYSARLNIIKKIRNEHSEDLKETQEEKKTPSGEILSQIDIFRQNLMDPEDAGVFASEKKDTMLEISSRIYALYERFLTEKKEIDFERMIQWSVKILEADANADKQFVSQFEHVLVDEFQDINYSQKIMIDNILKGGANYWVVGDDDQAIYGWRGSNVKYILEFEEDYPGAEKVNLVQNYRSGRQIIYLAKELASHLTHRHDKKLNAVTTEKGNAKILNFSNEEGEASEIVSRIRLRQKEGIKNRDMAVLARTNNLPAAVASKLALANIPFFSKDGSGMFSDSFSKQLITGLATSEGKKIHRKYYTKISPQLVSFAEALTDKPWTTKVSSLSTFITKRVPESMDDDERLTAVEAIETHKKYLLSYSGSAEVLKKLNAFAEGTENSDAVYLGTIHGAKGLEWNSVFIIGWEDSVLPHSLSINRLDEERRLAYVGITRAKDNLVLSYVNKRNGMEKGPSPFLSEIVGRLVKKAQQAEQARKVKEKEKQSPITAEKSKTTDSSDISTTLIESPKDLIEKSKESKRQTVTEFNAAEGLLSFAGYSANKNGPSDQRRQNILANIFYDAVRIPDFISDSVLAQWGKPRSPERFKKLKDSINSFKSLNEGRKDRSEQAIRKWEKDIQYLENTLSNSIEVEDGS